MRDAVIDLLLGGRCVGCGRAGRVLCPACAAVLPLDGVPVRPTPVPPGLAPVWSAGPYDGLLRAAVVGHKERRLLALTRPLGAVLAGPSAAAAGAPSGGPLVLVPVPSRPASVRARGHDPTHAVTVVAARCLAPAYDVRVARLLVTRPGVVDQSGLGAAARAANLAGSMSCPTPLLRRLARRVDQARVVVCDDVLTTGSTVREAQRALEAVGLAVTGIATVAATPRRSSAGPSAGSSGRSSGRSSGGRPSFRPPE